ncbi:hypothetical protein MRX96_056363 [Rhipicephalus microplus]
MTTTHFLGVLQLILLSLYGCNAKSLKYQAIVYPEVFDARGNEETRVLKINEDITLNLKPRSILHPQFFLRTYREGIAKYTYFNVDVLEKNLYDDEKHFAAVVLNEEDDSLQVNGVVGPNLKITPAVGMERSEDGLHPHILETIHDTESDHVYAAYNIEAVYPEVLLIVDSRLFLQFRSYKHMLYYYMVQFTCISLRYTTVDRPKVRPVFRGIEVTNYTQEHKYYHYVRQGIDALKSLYSIVDFYNANNDTYGIFDLVYFATGWDMIAVQGAVYESALQGFAFVGSACTDKRQQLGEDKADSYIGIRIMSHEMGHTLGCSHDGTSVDGIIKGFRSNSNNCPWEDGYIMSYKEEDRRSYRFSSCCDYMMSLVSWSYEGICLRSNQTYTTINISKTIYLPGQVLDRNMQCRMTYPQLPDTYYMEEYGAYNCKAECYVNGKRFQASDSHWSMLLIDGSVCDDRTKRSVRCKNTDCDHPEFLRDTVPQLRAMATRLPFTAVWNNWSREAEGSKVVKINEDLTLNLEKSSVMGKEFLLRTYQGHVMQHNYLDGEALEEDLYHDARMFASVMVSEENGLQVEGVLSPKWAIKPLKGQKRSDQAEDTPHVIYNIEDHDGIYAGEGVAIEERADVSGKQNQSGGRPDTVYPELLIMTDTTFSTQFETNYTLLNYLIIAMNSVNVRYLTLSRPSVRIKFCALEILTVTEESFLFRDGDFVEGTRSLASLRDYVQNNGVKYDTYDGVYLVTGLDMAEPSQRGWNRGVLGKVLVHK